MSGFCSINVSSKFRESIFSGILRSRDSLSSFCECLLPILCLFRFRFSQFLLYCWFPRSFSLLLRHLSSCVFIVFTCCSSILISAVLLFTLTFNFTNKFLGVLTISYIVPFNTFSCDRFCLLYSLSDLERLRNHHSLLQPSGRM